MATAPLTRARTLGSAPAPALKPQSKADLVTLATLVRGRVYYFQLNGQSYDFEINKHKVVSNELADALENLYETTKDTDGELYEKAFFYIERDVPRPVEAKDPSARTVRRLPVRPPPKR